MIGTAIEETERSLMAAVMMQPEFFDQIREYLTPGDFESGRHRATWKAFGDLRAAGLDFTPVTLWDRVKRNGTADQFSGFADVGEYVDGQPFFSRFESVRSYVELVLRASIGRQMQAISSFATATLADGQTDEYALIESVQARYKALQSRRLSNDWTTGSASIRAAIADLERIAAGEIPDSVSTGLPALDSLLINHGLIAGQYFILGARTSKGKSTLALQMATAALTRAPEKVVAYFTVEMSSIELMKRLVAIHARIPYDNFRRGLFSREEARAIMELEDLASRWQFPIIHKGKLTPSLIHAESMRIRQEYGRLDLVVIDHIGLLRHEGRHDNRVRELAAISNEIKGVLVDLECAGIVPAQINREGEKRGDHRLQLRDLRDCGDLEQDADIVGLMNVTREGASFDSYALDIAKQRNGRAAVVELMFDKSCGRFESYGTDYRSHSEIEWNQRSEAASVTDEYWKK